MFLAKASQKIGRAFRDFAHPSAQYAYRSASPQEQAVFDRAADELHAQYTLLGTMTRTPEYYGKLSTLFTEDLLAKAIDRVTDYDDFLLPRITAYKNGETNLPPFDTGDIGMLTCFLKELGRETRQCNTHISHVLGLEKFIRQARPIPGLR